MIIRERQTVRQTDRDIQRQRQTEVAMRGIAGRGQKSLFQTKSSNIFPKGFQTNPQNKGNI